VTVDTSSPPEHTSKHPALSSSPARRTSRPEALSEGRYKLQLTIGQPLHDKLERAQDLLRHVVPDGDLAEILGRAVDALLVQIEKATLGKSARRQAKENGDASAEPPPREGAKQSATSSAPNREDERAREPDTARVGRPARRTVFERDREQCTFVSKAGERCPSRAFLEIDHIQPVALGGAGNVSNLRLLCRNHNRLAAEAAFGKDLVARAISSRKRQSRTTPRQRT
jgi:hypothetical protein